MVSVVLTLACAVLVVPNGVVVVEVAFVAIVVICVA